VVSAGRECFAPVICAPAFLPADDAGTFLSIAKGVPTLHTTRSGETRPRLRQRCIVDGHVISVKSGTVG
jgi:hypothetical protein